MKFDAMTLGNHEFDDGEDAIAPFLDIIKFPVTTANVKPNAQSKLGDRIKPSLVLEIGGQKIGIVGGLTNDVVDIASPGPNVTIEDDVTAMTAEVEKLKAAGVNKIIALTHIGYVRERDVIAKIPGVDVVVGGHSHSLLSNTDPKAEGPYPTMVDNPDGYKVPVVQAASYSKYLGEIKIVFDDNGVVKEATGDPIFLDKSVTPDAAVLARIKELGAPIEALKTQEVSETTAAVDGSRDNCRARECAMGDLVSDAILDRVKDQGVQIVFQNGGGLRASIDQGVVTMGEVLTVLPFQNTLATFQISGKDVVAALENGAEPARRRRRPFRASGGAEIFLRQVGAREQPHLGGRGDGRRRLEADRARQDLSGCDQQLCPPGRRRLQDLRHQRAERLRLRSGPRAGRRRLSRRRTGPTRPSSTAASPRSARPWRRPTACEAAPAAEAKLPELPAASSEIAANPPKADAPAAGATAETAAAAEAKPADAAANSHVIVAGDNFWNLAKTFYKDPTKWRAIADANPGNRPRTLQIGNTLTIPPSAAN